MHVRIGTSVYRHIAASPKMYILRGVSGSGKSTKAKQLVGNDGEIFSTDDFFTSPSGKYNFDINFISDAHGWNKDRVKKAVAEGVSPIVVDNTTVRASEAKPYVKMAQDAGYDIEIVEPDSPWWKDFGSDMDEDGLLDLAETLSEKNTHGVPEEVILKMLRNWEHDITVNDILSAEDYQRQ